LININVKPLPKNLREMKLRLYLLSFASLFLMAGITACKNAESKSPDHFDTSQPRNIILVIADGLGFAQLNAAIDKAKEKLNMETAEYAGMSKTHSSTHKITDSAAAGTAIASGNKTKNGVIGQDTLGNEFESILEIAEKNGLSTGLVSTSRITHATPAAFIAHELSRNSYEAIADDFLDVEIDVFIGGGLDNFKYREDGRDLTAELKEKGYTLATSIEDVMSAPAGKLAGLISEGHMPPASEGRNDILVKSTEKAIEILNENEKGFFLMVEASQIDWGGHDNNIDYILGETFDLDETLGKILDFALADGETLVVVTSDHETGGLTLPSDGDDYTRIAYHFSTGGHSAALVPVLSWGPGAGYFSGIMDNTDFFPRFMKLYGFEE
jgi:alkaline phosphatase